MTYRREHDSKGEKAFIKKYLKGFNPIKSKTGEILAYSYEVKKKSKNNILWSCHIDTMHKNQPDIIKQEVYLDQFDIAFVDEKSDCLGADNGAGVFLMLEMIEARIAGTYIFHRGEEKGCWGSSQIANDHEEYPQNLSLMRSPLIVKARLRLLRINRDREPVVTNSETSWPNFLE
jgi:hypothetical protein